MLAAAVRGTGPHAPWRYIALIASQQQQRRGCKASVWPFELDTAATSGGVDGRDILPQREPQTSAQ